MRSQSIVRLAIVAVVAATFTAQAVNAPPSSAYDSPGLPEVGAQKPQPQKELSVCGLAKSPQRRLLAGHRAIPSAVAVWAQVPDPTDEDAGDTLWEARYLIYQELISQGSTPLFRSGGDYLEAEDGTPICLLHGRSDVLDNSELIRTVAAEYPSIAPVVVAACIAEQASDVERIFGLDVLEKTILSVPGQENMSIGIAQIRPTEAMSLGLTLDPLDLFDPEIAVRGMVAKLRSVDQRIDTLQDPDNPVSLTERYMLLSLGQNSPGIADEYFQEAGNWNVLLSRDNNARVMRYFLVHLDWLVANGWELPEDVDLDHWRKIAFSSPQEIEDPNSESTPQPPTL
ncbi:MAG: hypothetical protein MUF84_03595 [Anaerolineae bacterium]|jgi:hypothetical protein|nr:hypothetical protein [Anaerolineae bacterium]